jgi:cytochrome c oxidase subunit IV
MTQHIHIVPLKTNLAVFVALLVMLLATVGAAELDLGRLNTIVALSIAVAKALIIMLYFMHVKYSGRITKVFAGAAFFWLGILIALSMSDYLTRGWLGIDGK